ncbi:hypothetical protein D6D01_08786 [Aureobasidium pullulans]|uniref:Uncharacterized protein n=1 Tax=Aureobasidium pullulans TaxID=5580 RepID=A0A4S9KAH9_AURPU|nr:hypothetical protein D6D01_08786 [Aureobasidium pullulans]
MDSNHLSVVFERRVAEERPSYVRIIGRHNVSIPDSSSLEEVVDFDLKADASEFIELSVIELTTSANSNKVHILAAGSGENSEENLMRDAVDLLEDIGASENDMMVIINQITNQDGMTLSLQRSAEHARYGGRVQFKLENVTESPSDTTTHKPVIDGQSIQVSLAWKYKPWYKPEVEGQSCRNLPASPSICTGPRPVTWNHRIQHAMVDGQHGLITLEDEFAQVAPMMKAIRKYALYEPLGIQGHFGTSRIHKWGLDEPNEEPPYVGRSYFGGGGMQSVARNG